ncbi:hypothetical protein VAS14_16002 [Vibrio angustum S14]|uniref:Uncharacterized protein n=1 Tax=Photobacterium angustum (strain S14 / CCUG 15956) TaxID=314292 RepID=Q1ZME0_PHOAS|nr:hypothetical protein [Photobacterium angustum]EAS63300.1 hypothetical protein VAS14_16002 [Vibrio angustum S14] [Photobacterium angustum S14]
MKYKLLILSLLVVLFFSVSPLIFGLACDSQFYLKKAKDLYIGQCHFGVVEIYQVKDFGRDHSADVVHYKGIFMQFFSKAAIYVNSVAEQAPLNDIQTIKEIVNIRNDRFYKFEILNENSCNVEVKLENGNTCKINKFIPV